MPDDFLDTVNGDDIETLRVRLAETIAWVETRRPISTPDTRLRTGSLRPSFFLPAKSRKELVAGVAHQRENHLIYHFKLPKFGPAPSLQGGRLLLYMPDETLSEGATEAATDDFFDVEDCPPWDLWLGYVVEQGEQGNRGWNRYLVSWIPEDLVTLVNEAIPVSSTYCIRWLDREPRELATTFSEMGLAWRGPINPADDWS